MSKQDGYASRTAADLERKYNFGQTFAEIFGLAADARKVAEEAQSAIEGLDQEQIFNLLTNYGKAQGIYRDDNGDVYVNASYIQSGTLNDGVLPASIARKSDLPELIGQLGYLDETGVTTIVKGVVTTDYVNALGITVHAAQIKDVLVIGEQLPANLAVKSDIPKLLSQMTNDSGYVKESGVTTIVKGVVTTDYVNALGLQVNAANITGTLTIGQLPDGIATADDITTITENAIKTASISADQIKGGTIEGVTLRSTGSSFGDVEIGNASISIGSGSIYSYSSRTCIEDPYGLYLSSGAELLLEGAVRIYPTGSAYHWTFTEDGIYLLDGLGSIVRRVSLTI